MILFCLGQRSLIIHDLNESFNTNKTTKNVRVVKLTEKIALKILQARQS